MSEDILALFTSPELNYLRLFELRILLAKEESLRKEFEVFVDDFDKSKNVIPATEFELRRAIAWYLLGDYSISLKHLGSENTPGAKLYQALNHISSDQKTKAREAAEELVDVAAKSGDQGIVIQAAIFCCDLRDVEKLNQLIDKIDGPSAGMYLDFIQAYKLELEKQHQEAIDAFEKLSEQDHILQAQALFHYAKLLDMWGYEDEALETYFKIEKLGFAYEEVLINIGVILEDNGEYNRAMRYYEKALKINPNNSRAQLYHSGAEACLNMQYDERKMKQDVKTSEILAIPISDFELSVRSRNCLSKMGIFTLKDLITKTEQELLSYKNFGETSLKEIRAMLSKKGLHLGMTRVEEQPLAERIKLNTQLFNQDKNFNLDQLDIPIEELNLSYRTKSALHKMGFESLRDITMRTGRDLEANQNFSAACLQEVNALLEERGLSYRPETSTSKPDSEAATAAASGTSLLGDEAPATEEVVVAETSKSEEIDDHYDDE